MKRMRSFREHLAARFKAGKSVVGLARRYGCTMREVEAAVRWVMRRAPKGGRGR